MRNVVLLGDVREKLREIPDGVVQTCVTSPPYFGLRSYLPNGVRLRADLTLEQVTHVMSELDRLGIKPVDLTSE